MQTSGSVRCRNKKKQQTKEALWRAAVVTGTICLDRNINIFIHEQSCKSLRFLLFLFYCIMPQCASRNNIKNISAWADLCHKWIVLTVSELTTYWSLPSLTIRRKSAGVFGSNHTHSTRPTVSSHYICVCVFFYEDWCWVL